MPNLSDRIKGYLLNSGVALLALVFSLLAGEALLRIYLDKAPWETRKSGHHKIFCEYDSVLGWRKIPNKTGRHFEDEYDVLESFNSRGLRGPEYSYEKNEAEYRILILGDSFAEGYTVEFAELFSEVLKKEMNNNGNKYCEVINCGTAGYSTDQELLFFQREGNKYRPDLAILLFYDNDPWYNTQSKYWRGYKPLFKLENGKVVLTNVPVPKPDTSAIQIISKKRSFFRGVKDWCNYNSYLYVFLRQRIENSYDLFSLAIKLGLAETHEIARISVPDEFKVFKKTYDDDVVKAWEITAALIKQLNEEIVSANGKLLVFYVSPRSSIYLDDWQATKRKYEISDQDWDTDRVGIELRKICEINKIDFIEPTESFKTEAAKLGKNGKQLYFVEDGHWNREGHEFVGETLARYINSNYLMKTMTRAGNDLFNFKFE